MKDRLFAHERLLYLGMQDQLRNRSVAPRKSNLRISGRFPKGKGPGWPRATKF
jgi:hypothetical protein